MDKSIQFEELGIGIIEKIYQILFQYIYERICASNTKLEKKTKKLLHFVVVCCFVSLPWAPALFFPAVHGKLRKKKCYRCSLDPKITAINASKAREKILKVAVKKEVKAKANSYNSIDAAYAATRMQNCIYLVSQSLIHLNFLFYNPILAFCANYLLRCLDSWDSIMIPSCGLRTWNPQRPHHAAAVFFFVGGGWNKSERFGLEFVMN